MLDLATNIPMTPKHDKKIMVIHVKGSGGPMGELMKMMGGINPTIRNKGINLNSSV